MGRGEQAEARWVRERVTLERIALERDILLAAGVPEEAARRIAIAEVIAAEFIAEGWSEEEVAAAMQDEAERRHGRE
jgi:hypothetical protein